MAADIDHAKIVEQLGDTHEKRVISILQQLEDEIAELVISAPQNNKKLFDLAWAIQARQDIETTIQTTFITQIDTNIRDYAQVVDSLGTMFTQYEAFVGVSPETISALQRISFQGFQDIASTFADELANELYQNTLTGRPVAESVKSVRQKINGVYIQSDQTEIKRLVDIANSDSAGAEDAVKELHRIYAADRSGNNMRRYATQMVHDSLMQFDASMNVAAGQEIGAERWKYFGSVIRDSREWCKSHVGQTYTEEEIRILWSSNSWSGKASGDAFIVRGGYNCRHHWRPVFDSEIEEQDIIEEESPENTNELTDAEKTKLGLASVKGSQEKVEQAENILNETLDPLALEVAEKLPKPNEIVSKKNGGLYESYEKRLTTDIRQSGLDVHAVTAHEYGHHVDYEIGLRDGYPRLRSWSESNSGFAEAFQLDRKALGIIPAKTRNEVTFNLMNELLTKKSDGSWDFESNPYDGNLCDILDALALGNARNNFRGFGHSVSYWKRKGAKEKECFANMFSIYGTPNWEKVERIAPNMASQFVKKLQEVANDG